MTSVRTFLCQAFLFWSYVRSPFGLICIETVILVQKARKLTKRGAVIGYIGLQRVWHRHGRREQPRSRKRWDLPFVAASFAVLRRNNSDVNVDSG